MAFWDLFAGIALRAPETALARVSSGILWGGAAFGFERAVRRTSCTSSRPGGWRASRCIGSRSPVGGCSQGARAGWDHALQGAPASRAFAIDGLGPFGTVVRPCTRVSLSQALCNQEVCRGSGLGDLSAQRPVCGAIHRKGTSPRRRAAALRLGVSWLRHGCLSVRTAGGLEQEVSSFISKSGLRRASGFAS